MFRRTVFALYWGLTSCGPASLPAAAPESSTNADAGTAKPATTTRERLARALLELENTPDVVGGLAPALRKTANQLIASLSAEQRKQLAGEAGAQARPLLHLLAGGSSPAALAALGSSRAGADEVLALRPSRRPEPDMIASVSEVSRRAARQFLRARAVDLGGAAAVDRALILAIDQTARTLGRNDLRRLARALLTEVDPKPDHFLYLASAAAWELDIDGAEAALARAGTGGEIEERAAAVRRSIEYAQLARSVKKTPPAPDELAKAARALSFLGRHAEAKKLIAPQRAAAEKDLDLAAALATAEVEASVCPGIPEGIGNELMCAAAWSQDARPKKAIALLESAWKSGGGRSEVGVETYLGLAHVIPWTFATISQEPGEPTELAQGFRERLAVLSAGSKEAAKVSPRFRGVVLFVDVLSSAFEASVNKKPGARTALDSKLQRQLIERAETLIQEQPKERLAQAALLAVAASLAQERDVLALVDKLPDEIDRRNRLAREVLRVWYAVGRKQPDLAKDAINNVAGLMPEADVQALERARLVLLVAEASAALSGQSSDQQVLERVTRNLIEPGVPNELRLRAALDRAGALSRLGKGADAAEMLSQVLLSTPPQPPGSTEADLLLVCKTYLLALRGRASTGAERKEYAERLDEMLELPELSGAPASVRLFHTMWKRELAALQLAETCKGAGCAARADAKRRVTRKEVDDAIGVQSGNLLRAGVLPAGTLSLSFNYSGSDGLEPLVRLDPRLISAEIPAGVAH
ncbi:MAG TPA: hypothetical protein PKD61_00035 [Polyangiaceae bacterium]|nr:hypothetical protein [Polyangiaceae bacterium]